ncbi:Proline-rich protein PRCC [Liparis tanakae]|uniref:Proline-rich protein PRCC n=1 Tax=Liparis tanakae TaxID=230148 RepID=A0A4Z2HD02_9TELE|nr:Proline-rich protein PRCC [Liparis tanakae]
MSLVAYASSDESDSEGSSAAPQSKGLFSVLPAPKKPRSTGGSGGPRKEIKASRPPGNGSSSDGPTVEPQPSKGGLFSSLPKPRKRTEPVKITVPQIQRRDPDSDDDEPVKKKVQPQGTGLSSLLPEPRNMSMKSMSRSLVPHTLTKRQEPKGPKSVKPAQGLLGSSASPSAIKAAAKSAALLVARQIASEDREEDMTPQNYFSLGESSPPLPAVDPSLELEQGAIAEPLALAPGGEPGQSDAPLDFGGNQEGAGPWVGQCPPYEQAMEGPGARPEGYYNEPFFQDPETGSAEAGEPGSSAMFEDEAFMRLQGKRNRGKEEVKFLEIKGDDQLSGNKQWMTKSMTEEKQTRQSFSKAKEREMELKNSWADNKLSRRQTQAKYGF